MSELPIFPGKVNRWIVVVAGDDGVIPDTAKAATERAEEAVHRWLGHVVPWLSPVTIDRAEARRFAWPSSDAIARAPAGIGPDTSDGAPWYVLVEWHEEPASVDRLAQWPVLSREFLLRVWKPSPAALAYVAAVLPPRAITDRDRESLAARVGRGLGETLTEATEAAVISAAVPLIIVAGAALVVVVVSLKKG